ncbi:hypothetical protein A2477_04170 [Candidatus Falkowbacteria bacterium RIFOXYC2_FULL_47_12]|nr:MAG: hypothetical protein A2477_04170 [Candidatus Falkowbacteria bacterium RIFOXYC2_FULL_47_12]
MALLIGLVASNVFAAEIASVFRYPVGDENGDGWLENRKGVQWLREYDYEGSCGVTKHPGVDFNKDGTSGDDDLGQPVYAVANGQVVKSYYESGSTWGNLILIRHVLPNGELIFSLYGHLDTRMVSDENLVTIGQQIGTVGKGIGLAAHLHFEIRKSSMNSKVASFFPCGDSGYDEAFVIRNYFNPETFIKIGRFLNQSSHITTKFVERYELKLGVPFQDVDGNIYVHDWNGVMIQNFQNNDETNRYGTDGQTALIYNSSQNKCWLVKEGCWGQYKTNNGAITYGAARSDEVPNWLDKTGAYGQAGKTYQSAQEFDLVVMLWDGQQVLVKPRQADFSIAGFQDVTPTPTFTPTPVPPTGDTGGGNHSDPAKPDKAPGTYVYTGNEKPVYVTFVNGVPRINFRGLEPFPELLQIAVVPTGNGRNPQPFSDRWFGKYEITQEQFIALLPEFQFYYANGQNLPVRDVTLNETQEFCARLNQSLNALGYHARVPTEDEWYTTARWGLRDDTIRYFDQDGWGNSGVIKRSLAQYLPGSYPYFNYQATARENYEVFSIPSWSVLDKPAWVSKLQPNPHNGIVGQLGNVSELTLSAQGTGVACGGAFFFQIDNIVDTAREAVGHDTRKSYVGFRILLETYTGPAPTPTMTPVPTSTWTPIMNTPTSTPIQTTMWTLVPVNTPTNTPSPTPIIGEHFVCTKFVLCRFLFFRDDTYFCLIRSGIPHNRNCVPYDIFLRYNEIEPFCIFAEFSYLHQDAQFLIIDYFNSEEVWRWHAEHPTPADLYWEQGYVQLRASYWGKFADPSNPQGLGVKTIGRHEIHLYILIGGQQYLVGKRPYEIFKQEGPNNYTFSLID